MSQYSFSLDFYSLNAGALLVREIDGAVHAASRKEILTVARELVNVDELYRQMLDKPGEGARLSADEVK